MTLSPPVAGLLAEFSAQGIEVELVGNAIRFRPSYEMTPDFLKRLRAHKSELLCFLTSDAVIVELRQSIKYLQQNPAWRSAWERRFRAARYANFDSLQRVLGMVIDQAADHHRRHDWNAFASACRYLHRLASGEL